MREYFTLDDIGNAANDIREEIIKKCRQHQEDNDFTEESLSIFINSVRLLTQRLQKM